MKCRFLDVAFPIITHLGGATFTLLSLLFLMMFFSELRLVAAQSLLSLSLSHVIAHIIKKAYCRPRPYNVLSAVNLCAHPLKDYSFPSGHTTAAFAIAVMFSMYFSFLAPALIFMAFLVGLSRMYLGLHYPTDCIIGAFLGSFTSGIVVYVSKVLFLQ